MEKQLQLQLQSMSDDELLDRLSALMQQSRRVESELVAHIGEVDARRLYVKKACSSMFKYATEVLHLSEHEAYLRIEVARASRKHPELLTMLGDGRLHLSGIALLSPHLTEANREALLASASHQSKRQIEKLVAELAPKPDVPSKMRKLPAVPVRSASTVPPPQRTVTKRTDPKPVVKPLAPARYKVTFTASAELHDKLNRLRALMRSSMPEGDLAAVVDAAVTEKLERLESMRFGKTKAPRKSLDETDTSPRSRYIPVAVRRLVAARDGERCAFVDSDGKRCTERDGLEFHHHDPFALGGRHDPENVSLMCKAHNAYLAECDYGKTVMGRYRTSAGRVSEPTAVYFAESSGASASFFAWRSMLN